MNDEPFKEFRWFERQRMNWIASRTEPLRRKHLMEAFDISQAQASMDINKFMRLKPNMWRYNLNEKQYERVEKHK